MGRAGMRDGRRRKGEAREQLLEAGPREPPATERRARACERHPLLEPASRALSRDCLTAMSVRTLIKSIQDTMRKDTGVDGDAQRISQLCWMFFLKIIDDQDQELELINEDYASPILDRLRWRTWAADAEGITGEELLTFINGDLFPALKSSHQRAQPPTAAAWCATCSRTPTTT